MIVAPSSRSIRFQRLWIAGLLLAFAPPTFASDPMDWTYWRGPEQNGISRERNIVDKWSPSGENLLWKDETAGGRSTPIIMKGKLYTIVRHLPDTKNEGEKVLCLDAATGKKIWENIVQTFLTDVPTERTGWSSVVGDPETNRVYALSGSGLFQCIDAETGKTIWSHSMSEEYGLLSTYGGRTNFPILFENLVIISGVMIGWGDFAKPNHRFIAFDKNDGKVVWFNATRPLPDDTTYSAPVIAVINGKQQMIVGAGDGFLHSFQPRTGKLIWKYHLSRRGVNCTPLVVGDMVYMGQSEENPGETSMGALVAIQATGQGDVTQSLAKWKNKGAMIGRATPLYLDGKLFAVDDGAGLYTYDAETGKQLFTQKFGTAQRASPLYVDGKIYTIDMNGRWTVLKPKPDGSVSVVHKMRLRGEGLSSPVVSHGRLYVQTLEGLYCAGKKDVQPSADPIPPQLKEVQAASSDPAQIQIVPAEVLVKPGEKVEFEARLFNTEGQLVEKRPVQYECNANGTVDASGVFTAGTTPHSGAVVTAKLGDAVGEARVRIVPDFPWSIDFSGPDVPLSWIGMRYRHVIRKIDGDPAMVKITTIPKGQRSQGWIGRPDMHDYTIQADVRAVRTDDKLPDVGLIAQRYTLDLMGQSQNLQIRTWTASTRRAMSNKPFVWKEGEWYTMKFRAANEGDKAVLRGKVWKRGEAEPADWTIELVDEAPNRTGSPGFFGNAQNSEVFIDNVKVNANG
jgi:outer membrane protein assembly factor BamB